MKITPYTHGMAIPENGFVSGVPNEVYQAISTHVSNSRMKLMQQSAYHYFNPSPFTDTRPKQIGSAIHAKVLEPDNFAENYMMLPELKDRRQPEYKQAVKQFGDSCVFVGNECQNIDAMFDAIYGNDDAAALLNAEGHCELSGFATCPRTGLKLRVRFDKLLLDGRAVDLKKTQSVHQDDISKAIYNYGYHIQDAFYSYVYGLIAGSELESFNFIFAEEKYPNKVLSGQLDDISREIGRKEVEKLLDLIKHYSDNAEVPANNEPSTIFSLPEFVMRQYEDEIF